MCGEGRKDDEETAKTEDQNHYHKTTIILVDSKKITSQTHFVSVTDAGSIC